ncbi:MAG: hypothetical protein ABSF25_13575 [Bryobacteraceae bacterium]|jgi:hypothetical protein
MNATRLGTILVLAGFVLRAQTMPADADAGRARELLNSTDLAEQSWGAYYAGRLRDPGLRDILVQRLRAAQPLANARVFSAEFSYVAGLFDALIEIGGAVPLDAFLPFEGQWPAPVLVLLSRQQGTEDTLLAMRNETMHDLYWLAVNNLLFGMRSGRFFTETLKEIPITHIFEVRDGEVPKPPGSGWGGSWATGVPQWPSGFPPAALYYISGGGVAGQGQEGQYRAGAEAALIGGPRNVYIRRAVPPEQAGGPFHSPGREQFRLEYMKAWNHGLTDVERVFRPQTALQWKDADTLSREVDGWLDAQVAAIRAFVAAAKQNGGPGLAGMRLQITPSLQDERRNSLVPLPAVSPREFTLE